MKTRRDSPATILGSHSSKVRSLANRLRLFIRKTIPEVEERAYPGWHGIGFRHPAAGYLCGIFPQEKCVKLYFEHGRLLPDPGKLFTGKGNQTGQIVFRKLGDIRRQPLQQLLHESVEFGIRKKRRR